MSFESDPILRCPQAPNRKPHPVVPQSLTTTLVEWLTNSLVLLQEALPSILLLVAPAKIHPNQVRYPNSAKSARVFPAFGAPVDYY